MKKYLGIKSVSYFKMARTHKYQCTKKLKHIWKNVNSCLGCEYTGIYCTFLPTFQIFKKSFIIKAGRVTQF